MDIVTFMHWLITCGRAFLVLYKLAKFQVYKTLNKFYFCLLNISDLSLNCPKIFGSAAQDNDLFFNSIYT